MSDKKEVGLSKVDIQAAIAAWIIANDGCGRSSNDVDCYGERGIFKGTRCPISNCGMSCFLPYEPKLARLREWLAIYHQEKAEAAETDRRKVEAAKKEELETKQEPARICGNCKHIHEVEKPENMIAHCDMKKNMVPILFDRCPDFEPRAKAKRDDEDECHADAIIYNGILISTPSQEDKLRHKVWLLEIKNSHSLNDIERLKAEAAKRTAEDAERISRLEKEKAELLEGRERLTEQRNRLSIDLVKATRREKDVEREKDIIAKKLVDFTAKWNDLSGVCAEKDGLIDRLRKENAELRSWYEQLKKDSFQRLFEALCKSKVLEKEIDRLLIDQSIMKGKMQLYVSPFR